MGYKRHIFASAVNPELICLSCEDVYREPWTNNSCGHTLCYICWLNRVETSNEVGVDEEYVKCLHCRCKSSLSESTIRFNDAINQTIMQLIVKCGNVDCRRRMPLMNREMHMEVCKYNATTLQLCCLKPSRRTNRIMRRTHNICRAISGRVLFKLGHEAINSALETYTKGLNDILEPIADNLESIGRTVDSDGPLV